MVYVYFGGTVWARYIYQALAGTRGGGGLSVLQTTLQTPPGSVRNARGGQIQGEGVRGHLPLHSTPC